MRPIITRLLKTLENTVAADVKAIDEKSEMITKISNAFDSVESKLTALANQELAIEKQKDVLKTLKLKLESTVITLAQESGLSLESTAPLNDSILRIKGSKEIYDTTSKVPLDCTFKFNAKVTNRSKETEARLQEQADRHDAAKIAKVAEITNNFYVKAKA